MRISILVVAWVLVACKGEVPPPVVKPVDAAATAAFAKELEAVLIPCDPARINAVIDYDTLGRLGVAGVPQGKAMLTGFLESARSIGLGASFCGTADDPSRYRLLGMWSHGGDSWPLFRSLGKGGVNYAAFRPGRDQDGKVRIVDYHNFMTGELTSETLRGILDAMMAKTSGQPGEILPATRRMREAMQKSDHVAARKALDALPSWLRGTKAMMLQHVLVSQSESEDQHQKAIDDYVAAFPGDPSLDLVSLDGLILRKEYAGALAAVDRIDTAVGGDPYLDSIRANLHIWNADLDKAVHHAKQAVTREPELEDLWWTLLDVHLRRKDLDQTLATVDEMGTRFGTTLDAEEMAKEPGWAFVLASPQWKKRQAAAAD